MNMKINHLHFCFILIFTLFCLSCAGSHNNENSDNRGEQSYTNKNAQYDFLFASDFTEFKNSITQKLVDKYKDRANIYVINTGNLSNRNADDYDVIVIMDTCRNNLPTEPSLNSFFSSADNKNKIILYVSANSGSCNADFPDIDAITTASKVQNGDSVFDEISGKIDLIIAGK